MTTATLTHALRGASLTTMFARAWATMQNAMARHRAIATTRQELTMLSDRELEDVGLTRADIEAAAYRAVMGR